MEYIIQNIHETHRQRIHIQTDIPAYLTMVYHTSGFWPRVRARALRSPVFLSSLPPQTGRFAPSPPIAASLPHIRPPKIFTIYWTWAAHVKGFFLSTGLQRLCNMRSPAPRPARILTVCCITDMHINDIHISVILRGFLRGPSLFWSIWGQN